MTAPTPPAQATNTTPQPTERRAAVRHRCLRNCLVWPASSPGVAAWSGMVYNISNHGIGLALPLPVGAGTILVIEPWGRTKARIVHARVVRTTAEAFVWFHGCELVKPLSDEEVRRWL